MEIMLQEFLEIERARLWLTPSSSKHWGSAVFSGRSCSNHDSNNYNSNSGGKVETFDGEEMAMNLQFKIVLT